jgi:site-specific recombinase XerD
VADLVPFTAGEVGEPEDRSVLLERLRDAWLNEVCRSPRTEAAYRRGHREWIAFLCAHYEQPIDLLHAQRHDIAAYRRDMENGSRKPAGVAQKLAIVSSFYRYCEEVGVIGRSPAAAARRPRVDSDNSSTVGLTQDEARRLIAAAEMRATEATTDRVKVAAERDAAMIAVMLCTGGRISETTHARIEDLGYDRGHRVLWLTRKGGTRKSVALGSAAQVVDRHVANGGRETGLLFRTSRGGPVDRSYIFRIIRRVARAAHIPAANQLSPHSLRHTFATLAFDHGVDISNVQDAMGHADPRTTRRYDRARNRIDKSPVHAISKALLGAGQ